MTMTVTEITAFQLDMQAHHFYTLTIHPHFQKFMSFYNIKYLHPYIKIFINIKSFNTLKFQSHLIGVPINLEINLYKSNYDHTE